jgi:4'-phosphopantetheinyl transferase
MWATPPKHPALTPGSVHVWKANLSITAQSQKQYLQILSPDEQERANRFIFEKDRTHFIAGRGILRKLLGIYLNEKPETFTFEYGGQGKPTLSGNPTLQFNLSHANGIALYGLTKQHDIGIDVEYIKKDIELKTLATQFFSKKEAALLLTLPKAQLPQGFFNCWTRKEAFIKADGRGLSCPLDQFEVSLIPGHTAQLMATHWDPEELNKWSMFSIDVQTGFVGALVVKGAVNSICHYQWEDKII